MEYLLSQVDQYCERTDFSFWSEPVNFWTNAAFLVAAVWLWTKIVRAGQGQDRALRGLIALIFLVGIGSGLFHSLATRFAQWCDIIPITLFVVLYLGVWMRQGLLRSWGSVAAGYTAFFALHAACLYVFRSGPLMVGGSEGYFAAAIFLLVFGRQQQLRVPEQPAYLNFAAITFVVSIVFRSIDAAVCGVLPLGTHFVWHLGNALVCTFLVLALVEVKSSRQH